MRFSSNPYSIENVPAQAVQSNDMNNLNNSIHHEEPAQMHPLIPNLLVKVIRNYKKSVHKVIYNQDKTRFALIWKTLVQDIELNYYDNLSPE